MNTMDARNHLNTNTTSKSTLAVLSYQEEFNSKEEDKII